MRNMANRCLQLVGLAVAGMFLVPSRELVVAAEQDTAQSRAADAAAVRALAERIDAHLSAEWVKHKTILAQPADDAEFLRRVSLDVAGVIPSVSDVRLFLSDPAPDKRGSAVDRVLNGSAYLQNFANVWRAAMLPEAETDIQVRFLLPGFEAWLRQELAEKESFAEIVRDLLTMPLDARSDRNARRRVREASPLAFYQAKQALPENLAAGTARVFMGLRIECAQCHDHPFDHWKRGQFWSYAAFFASVADSSKIGGRSVREVLDRRELEIPGDKTVVQASFLDGSEPRWKLRVSPRVTLADWLTSHDNPYFARAIVNRFWAHFFGIGLVDPVDDLSDQNAPSHPALLDELAREFAAHNYDMKFLIRTLTATQAYQSSSLVEDANQDPRLFARMPIKALSPEQLFDSLAQATGDYQPFSSQAMFAFGNRREAFLATFAGNHESRIERPLTILQALAMMNGSFVTEATNLERSQTLAAVAEYPFSNQAERIETLFLAALSRKPRPDELERFVAYVDSGGAAHDQPRALADVFWALLNSSEFICNH
jgi:uncharacterized protein DUF1553/uncharacterized protein DUF1549